jgi:hypothetical protein
MRFQVSRSNSKFPTPLLRLLATKSRFALAMMAFLAGGKLKEGLDKWREVGISEEVIEGVLGAHTAQLPQPTTLNASFNQNRYPAVIFSAASAHAYPRSHANA